MTSCSWAGSLVTFFFHYLGHVSGALGTQAIELYAFEYFIIAAIDLVGQFVQLV